MLSALCSLLSQFPFSFMRIIYRVRQYVALGRNFSAFLEESKISQLFCVCVCGCVVQFLEVKEQSQVKAIKPSQSVTGGRANAIIQFGSGEFANYCGNVIDK